MIRISQLKLPLSHSQQDINQRICDILHIRKEDIIEVRIFRQSIDARKKHKILFVYTIDVKIKQGDKILSKVHNEKISETPDYSYQYVKKGDIKLDKPPVIVGTGPSGLFAGLLLAEMGYNPILIERGKQIKDRVRDVNNFIAHRNLNLDSNVVFGEGGAGTFSDGKLYTNIKDKRCRKVLNEFIKCGAPEEIIYKWKPHIGTNILQNVVKNMRQKIISYGGKFYFAHKLTDLHIENNRIVGITIDNTNFMEVQVVILAIGHSARDTFEMLYQKGINIVPKPFSVGLRIEHPQKLIDKTQYGKFAGNPRLGSAEYKLAYHFDKRSVYTFCMCPGGLVIPASSEIGCVVTNGMSEYNRDKPNANSAVLVGITPEDFIKESPLDGIEFQRIYERKAFDLGGKNYNAPVQLVGDFLQNRKSTSIGRVEPTYKPGYVFADLSDCLPDYVVETLQKGLLAFDKKLKGFAMPDAVLTGVETRSSSPIRILRNQDNQCNILGLYVAGEGAGYAGGIMSAAVDGIKTAEALIKKYYL